MGQSILGNWTNLGAGTTTSNLKNNYSNVNVNYLGKRVDLDMQFLGLIMGDHSKSSIGTLFNTATIVGACTNIFGPEMPSKFVPSFRWGNSEDSADYDIQKVFETAKHVMKRRGVNIDQNYENLIKNVFSLAKEIEQI